MNVKTLTLGAGTKTSVFFVAATENSEDRFPDVVWSAVRLSETRPTT